MILVSLELTWKDWFKVKYSLVWLTKVEMRTWLDSVNEHQNTVTTLYIQIRCLTHQLFQVSCLLPSFGRLSKSVLTKIVNCLEVRWTIPHLFRQEVDYRFVKVGLYSRFVYDRQHFHFEVKWAFPHSIFFFFFTIFFSHFTCIFTENK